MAQLTADVPAADPAIAGPGAPCRACPDGRVGPWAPLRAGGQGVLLGDLLMVGRHCDRCSGAELQAHAPLRQQPGKKAPRPPASGSELLSGLLHNLVTAASELMRAMRKRHAP
jgi:hypothetical protein